MDNLKTRTNVGFVLVWFGTATTTLFFSIIFSVYLSGVKLVPHANENFKLYAALPKSETAIQTNIAQADARAKIIENFLKSYRAPLADYSLDFVETADKYQLDWRLLPAIAMQESNGGKRVIKNSYNPFGWGIYENLVIRFNSWEEAIERVGRALREDYLNQGLRNPTQIMAKYTPPSLAKGGTWAKGVSLFMEELR